MPTSVYRNSSTTPRKRQVFELGIRGQPNKQIGEALERLRKFFEKLIWMLIHRLRLRVHLPFKSKHETFLPQLVRALNWSGHGQTGLMSRIGKYHLVPTIHAGQRENHSTRLQSESVKSKSK